MYLASFPFLVLLKLFRSNSNDCIASLTSLITIFFGEGKNTALGPRCTKPGLQAGKKKRAHHKYRKNNYSSDGLPSSWIHQTVGHLFFSFCIYGYLGFFFRLQSGLSISWALELPLTRSRYLLKFFGEIKRNIHIAGSVLYCRNYQLPLSEKI